MQRTRWCLLPQAVIAALALGTPALAQDAQPAEAPAPAATPADDRGIEEIIVTATKREANIQDIPIAVSAFQAEELAARRIDEIEDLAQVSPSIHVNTSNTSSAGGTLRIRGVGTTGNNIGLEAAVGTFIDGVYRSRSGQGFNDLLDIERIEVLRGPQGTLFGKNTSAGAINVVTKRPVLEGYDAWVSGEYGSYDHRKLSASVSAPIVDDILGFRLSATWNRRDGYYENLHSSSDSDDAGIRDRWTMRGQLLFAPTENLDFRFIADFTQRKESCCPAVLVVGGGTIQRVLDRAGAPGVDLGRDVAQSSPGVAIRGPDVSRLSGRKWHTGFNEEPFENIKDGGLSLEANWDLDWAKLSSLTSWRSFRAEYAQDIDFTSANILHPQDPDGGGAFDDFENFSQEIRAQGNAFDHLDWLFGFYGYTEDVSTHTRVEWGADAGYVIGTAANAAALPEGEGYERDASIDTGGWALFTNNTWSGLFLENFDVTIGARYGQETKEARSVVNDAAFGTFINPASCANTFFTAVGPYPVAQVIQSFCHNQSWRHSGVTEKEWTYTFSGAYHITEDINVYYSYSRGYKAGGFNTDQDAFDCALPAVGLGAIVPIASGTCAGQVGGSVADGTQFDPEFAKSHELGLKTTFLDGRARVNFTLFTTDFTDFQLNTFTGLGFIVSNAEKARSRGGELESFFAPIEGMTLTFGVTYADARYDDPIIEFGLVNPWPPPPGGPTPPVDGLPCVVATDDCGIDHRRLTNAPAWTGSGAISYEHVLPGTEWVAFGTVNSTYRGRHNTGSNLHPYKFEGAHWFGNINVGVRSPEGHWEASVWSTNFTNTFDRSIIFDTPTQSGTFHAFASPPRMWGGTLKYTF